MQRQGLSLLKRATPNSDMHLELLNLQSASEVLHGTVVSFIVCVLFVRCAVQRRNKA